MVQRIETSRDVAFHEPLRANPAVIDLVQRSMTTPGRAKAMRGRAELRLVIGLQDEAHCFLQQLVRPSRETEWTLLHRAFLLNVDAPYRQPSVCLMTQGVNDPADFCQRHPVDGFRRNTRCHRTSVTGDFTVGKQEELRVEQLSIDVLQRQSSPAAVVDDSQDGFGVSHLAYLSVRVSGHLPPFPMWTAFPSSEYYGGSVALRLAARRAIPYSRDAGRLERDVGASSVSLNGVYSPSPIAWKVRATTTLPPYRGGLDLRRCVEGCMLASLEAEVRAMRLSPYRAGLADHGRKRLRTISASKACYCPLWFSPPGKPLAQGSFLPNPSFLEKGSSAR